MDESLFSFAFFFSNNMLCSNKFSLFLSLLPLLHHLLRHVASLANAQHNNCPQGLSHLLTFSLKTTRLIWNCWTDITCRARERKIKDEQTQVIATASRGSCREMNEMKAVDVFIVDSLRSRQTIQLVKEKMIRWWLRTDMLLNWPVRCSCKGYFSLPLDRLTGWRLLFSSAIFRRLLIDKAEEAHETFTTSMYASEPSGNHLTYTHTKLRSTITLNMLQRSLTLSSLCATWSALCTINEAGRCIRKLFPYLIQVRARKDTKCKDSRTSVLCLLHYIRLHSTARCLNDSSRTHLIEWILLRAHSVLSWNMFSLVLHLLFFTFTFASFSFFFTRFRSGHCCPLTTAWMVH